MGGQRVHVLGLALLLFAVRIALAPSPPTAWGAAGSVVLAASANLAYEGAMALAVVVAGSGAGRAAFGRIGGERPGKARWGPVVVVLGVVAGFGALGLALASASAKPRAVDAAGLGRLVAIHFGVGVLPQPLIGIGLLVLVVAVASVARLALPSFRPGTRVEERLMAGGLAVLFLGAAPFLATGFRPGTNGIFDRGNLFADLGTAMVFAGAAGSLWRLPLRPWVALGGAAVLAALLAAGLTSDLRAYRDAAADGRRLLAAIDRLPPQLRTQGPLVIAPLPDRSGVSTFVEDYDLSASLRLRYHLGRRPLQARMLPSDEEAASSPIVAYRLVGDALAPISRS